jgi:hypothetical protein
MPLEATKHSKFMNINSPASDNETVNDSAYIHHAFSFIVVGATAKGFDNNPVVFFSRTYATSHNATTTISNRANVELK